MSATTIAEGYHGVTPYLGIENASAAIEFYQKAFDATQIMRLDMPDGRVGHAELRIGDSAIMLGTPCDQMPLSSPDEHTSVALQLYVSDVDAQFAQAIAAGAREVSKPEDRFYGDRSASVKDPFGHMWFLATRKENLTEEEVRQRAMTLFKQG